MTFDRNLVLESLHYYKNALYKDIELLTQTRFKNTKANQDGLDNALNNAISNAVINAEYKIDCINKQIKIIEEGVQNENISSR